MGVLFVLLEDVDYFTNLIIAKPNSPSGMAMGTMATAVVMSA